MRIEIGIGTTIFGDGTVSKTTTYHAESENEFWNQYVILKNANVAFKAQVDRLRLIVEAYVDVREAYQQEILKAERRMKTEEE